MRRRHGVRSRQRDRASPEAFLTLVQDRVLARSDAGFGLVHDHLQTADATVYDGAADGFGGVADAQLEPVGARRVGNPVRLADEESIAVVVGESVAMSH